MQPDRHGGLRRSCDVEGLESTIARVFSATVGGRSGDNVVAWPHDVWGPMSDKPKSALELVMDRLRRKDAEAGIEETPLTDEQRAAIGEARSIYESKVAERRIMHQSTVASVFDPAERAERDAELRRDLERFASERDAKIRRIRQG
jgi:hypothetical protein